MPYAPCAVPLEVSRIGVPSEDVSPDVTDLLNGGIFPDGIDEVRHQVLVLKRGLSDPLEALLSPCLCSGSCFTSWSLLSCLRSISGLILHITMGGWSVAYLLTPTMIFSRGIDLFLIVIGGVRDLGLRIASLNRCQPFLPSHQSSGCIPRPVLRSAG